MAFTLKTPALRRLTLRRAILALLLGFALAAIYSGNSPQFSWAAFAVGTVLTAAGFAALDRRAPALPPSSDTADSPPSLAADHATAAARPEPTIAELKADRARLALRRREIIQEMRSLRDTARMKTARVGGPDTSLIGSLIFGASTMRRIQRSGIRLGREQALAPLQAERDRLDSEINEIDRSVAAMNARR